MNNTMMDFAKHIMNDEKLRIEFLSSKDPSEFLQSRTGIELSELRKDRVRAFMNELKEKYAKKTREITEKERKIFGVSVPFFPYG